MIGLRAVSKLLLLLGLATLPVSVLAQDVVHAVAGVVTHVDKEAKTVAVKTADGTEHVFKYTEHTAVRDTHATLRVAKMGAVDTYFAGKQGTHVVVRYMEKGGDKTATVFDDFGKEGLKAGKGTVTHVDRAAHTVAIRTDDGAEATYKMGGDAVVETDHGVIRGTRYIAKEGDKVTVHYTEDAGHKIIHLFRKL
jgi:hypothetical protein